MVLQDTETVEQGDWEAVFSCSGENRDSNRTGDCPAAEVTTGISSNLEAGFLIPWQTSDGEAVIPSPDSAREEDKERGFGNLELAAKWRLKEHGRFEAAIAPTLSFPLTKVAQIRGVLEDSTVFDLPIVAAWVGEHWQLRGQLGYSWASRDTDIVTYGGAFSATPSDRFEFHLEIYRYELVDDRTSFVNWRIGAEWQLNGKVDLLAAFGGPISSDLEPEDRLKEDYYLGIRLNL